MKPLVSNGPPWKDRPYGIREIARVSHPVSSRQRYLAVVIAYFDESGHTSDEKSKTFVIGGWVSTERKWKVFEEKWKKRLRREGVTVFRMSLYENRQGEFAGWDSSRRIAFITDLAAITKNATIFGFGHGVIVKDWKNVMEPTITDPYERKRGPYVFLFQSCLEDIAQAVKDKKVKLGAGEKIACVLEENDLMTAAAVLQHTRLKKNQLLEGIFGGVAVQSKKDIVPLQAADMLAYEWYKDLKNREVEGGSRSQRKLLESLLKSKKLSLGFYPEANLRNFLRRAAEAELTTRRKHAIHHVT